MIKIPCNFCTTRVDCLLERECIEFGLGFSSQEIKMKGCQDINGCQTQIKCLKYEECMFLSNKTTITNERHGSPTFYALLEEMASIHSSKSYDYASNTNPYGNYKFAGQMSQLFKDADDAGFIGRIGEKLYRLANLENDSKDAKNESIEDTERDIATIIALWIAMRRDRRTKINQ